MSDVASVTARGCGVVKFYLDDKGYGFIEREGQSDVFVHANDLRRADINPKTSKGTRLEFDIVMPDGKGPKAVNVRQIV